MTVSTIPHTAGFRNRLGTHRDSSSKVHLRPGRFSGAVSALATLSASAPSQLARLSVITIRWHAEVQPAPPYNRAARHSNQSRDREGALSAQRRNY
jgi:hypothetical protein